jgi:replicative DNA helicase
MPPDECSVDDIYGVIDRNRRLRGWQPKVVIIDYLELMLSRHSHRNKEGDYTRQKSVSTEIRGLAKNESVLVYTANQTNRSAINNRENGAPIDVDKSAESFGKNMPVDYVISMNQTEAEYNQARPEIRLWIAKNRNGPKFVAVHTHVDYQTMKIAEVH